MELKVKWWLEKDGGLVLGKGRCMLLEAIDRGGSLRDAWGKLRASEDRLGEPLVETQPGKRGMKITPRARQLIKIFHSIDEKLQRTSASIVEKSLRD